MIIKMIQLMKKLVGGHKKIILIFFFLIFISPKPVLSSQILDYETDLFISSLINLIKKSNNIEKKFYFRIISDNNINAFVDENKVISITTGLIENSNDYVALLAVLAHEIGHIEQNHIELRKSSINKINKFRNISNLSILAGSMISNQPEILQGLALSSAGTTNYYLHFSKDQEREADYYSKNTLKILNLKSDSIIDLLNTIQAKNKEKGLTEEQIKFSTHPYFEERKEIINFLKNKNPEINENTNNRFKFIKAKYAGYSSNIDIINKFDEPHRSYSNAILNAKNGDLITSLKSLNKLISHNKKNIFLLETKADILFSYGYTLEAIKFYKKVLSKLPNNEYIQIRIFSNEDINKLNKIEKELLFYKNINLLQKYYNNKNILKKYLNLSNEINANEWSDFLSYWILKDPEDIDSIRKNLDNYLKTNDNELLNFINIINTNYK